MSKRIIKRIIALSVCLLIALSALPVKRAEAATGLEIRNAGFETPQSGCVIEGWKQSFGTTGVAQSAEQKYSGNYSLKLVDSSSTLAIGAECEKIFINAYESYTASAKVYVQSGKAEIYLRYYNSSGTLVGNHAATLTSPTGVWTNISITANAPSDAYYVKVLLYSASASVSTLYYDDVKLTRNGLVTNPGFESQLTGWTQYGGGSGTSVSASTAYKYSGNSSVKVEDNSSTLAVGVESAKISITPGETYKASAMCYIASGSGEIYLRYYDSNDALISSFNYQLSSPAGQWTRISVTGMAPSNAVKASVLLYSAIARLSTAYYDDVDITSAFTCLGTQINNIGIKGCAVGSDSSGKEYIYTVADGDPATFLVIDPETNLAIRAIDLPGQGGAWALTVASDNSVYVGTYSGGKLYKYTPGAYTITDLGTAISGQTYIFDLTPAVSSPKVYGGTYGGCNIFKYDNGAITQFGGTIVAGEQYARSVAYDDSAQMLYIGVGSHAHLIRFDCNSGAKVDILPSQYSSEEFVYDLDYAAGKIFAKLTPSYKLLVIDKNTLGVDAVLDVNSRGMTPLSPVDDKIYYTYNSELYNYDISSKSATDLGVNLSGSIIGSGYAQLNDTVNWPGNTLIGMVGNGGLMFKYNLTNGNYEVTQLQYPGQPTNLNNIKKGPDGKIYGSGFLSGGVSIYDPAEGYEGQYKGVGQSEGIGVAGSKLYFGVYPSGRFYSYDTSGAWNPVYHFTLSPYEQDRPVAVLGSDAENKVFLGTVPDYGKLGGAFTIYDIASDTYSVNRNIIANQSIISLAYKNGKVYGGSCILGGLGSTSTATVAKLFVWDVASGTKTAEITPVPGKTSITCLMVGPDGNIWGWAQGTLFILNPSNNSIIYSEEKFPGLGTAWRDAFMEIGNDGYVYGTINGKFFKINPSTKALTLLRNKGDASRLTKDDDGNMYFVNESYLWRYDPK